jgi:hypothetical protein
MLPGTGSSNSSIKTRLAALSTSTRRAKDFTLTNQIGGMRRVHLERSFRAIDGFLSKSLL